MDVLATIDFYMKSKISFSKNHFIFVKWFLFVNTNDFQYLCAIFWRDLNKYFK